MESNDKKRFIKQLAALSDFYEKELKPIVIEMYWQALEELNISEFETACKHVVKNCLFFPKPVDFIEYCRGKHDPDEDAIIAWNTFLEACTNNSYYDSVCFEDKVIHATIESLGGWQHVIGEWIDDSQLEWQQKLFVKNYKALAPSVRSGAIKTDNVLLGSVDESNLLHGFLDKVTKPKLIESPKSTGVVVRK